VEVFAGDIEDVRLPRRASETQRREPGFGFPEVLSAERGLFLATFTITASIKE